MIVSIILTAVLCVVSIAITPGELTSVAYAESETSQEQSASKTNHKTTDHDGGGDEGGFDEGGFDEGGFDEGGFDEGGFGDLSDIELKPSALPPPPSPLRVDGFARSQWAMWSERPLAQSWAKGRQSFDLSAKYKRDDWLVTMEGHLEYDLLYDVSDEFFDPVQEEEYRTQYIPGIQSISKRFTIAGVGLILSSGRQIVTWGESDGLSPLDVINPQDQREPGVADLDDMKLAVWLSRLQLSVDAHSVELMVRHEGNYGLLVPPQADYSPFNAIMSQSSSMLPPTFIALLKEKEFRFAHQREGVSSKTQSVFLRYQYRGAGFDLGIYAASLLDTQGVIGPMDVSLFLTQDQIEITYDHPRYTLTGLTFATPLGNFLWKGEVVGAIDRPSNTGEGDINSLQVAEVDTLTIVSGLTYSGFADTTLSVEYQRGFLIGDAPSEPFFIPPNLEIIAMRAQRNFWRERFSAGLVLSMIAPQWASPSALHQPERGGLVRADLSYRLLDQLKLGVGYVHYLTGESFGPFFGLEEHDRLFAQLRWDFTIY